MIGLFGIAQIILKYGIIEMMTTFNWNWKSIETAPKDRRAILLYRPTMRYTIYCVVVGQWDGKKWTHYGAEKEGLISVRKNQPTMWCEIDYPNYHL